MTVLSGTWIFIYECSTATPLGQPLLFGDRRARTTWTCPVRKYAFLTRVSAPQPQVAEDVRYPSEGNATYLD
ncbi:hypothetical protein V8D89_000461 [Ganoderma adspersum]